MNNLISIFGANGQIGSALVKLLGDKAIAITRAECDLSSLESIKSVLNKHNPSAIINAAAYTAVDKAESEPEIAQQINAKAPGAMAGFAAGKNIPFIHYSTDYVFDGSSKAPWKEGDKTNPLSTYGHTKLKGELEVASHGGRYLIFRTSWVYDAHGKNFFNTMLRLGAEREELKIVADQVGAPSYAPHLAKATIDALEKATAIPQFPSGIYNMCNSGETSWFGFAQEIFAKAKITGLDLKVNSVLPIATSDYPTPAKRPQNSRMSMNKLNAVFGITMPDWKEGLDECIEEKRKGS